MHHSFLALGLCATAALIPGMAAQDCSQNLNFTHTSSVVQDAVTDPSHQTPAMALAFGRVQSMLTDPLTQNFFITAIEEGSTDPRSLKSLQDKLRELVVHYVDKAGLEYVTLLDWANRNGLIMGYFTKNLVQMLAYGEPETIHNTADPLFYGSYTQDTITEGCEASPRCYVGAGVVPPRGTTCDDPATRCQWPTWTTCDSSMCNKTNCCLDDHVYLEYTNEPGSAAHGTDVTYVGQYDPRVRPWYYTSVDKWAKSGRNTAMTGVYTLNGGGGDSGAALAISAIAMVAGDIGSNGTNASPGSFRGGWFSGFDFTAGPENLVMVLDATSIDIVFNEDLTSIDVAVAAIGARLGNVASVFVHEDGGITIESSLLGASSIVDIHPTTGLNIKQKIFGMDGDVPGTASLGEPRAPSIHTSSGQDATAGTYIGERVPHVGSIPVGPDTGWDFSQGGLGPKNLVLDIDGTLATITLDADLTSPSVAVDFLNGALAGVATCRLVDDGFGIGNMIVESVTPGAGSYVKVHASSDEKAKLMLVPPLEGLLDHQLKLSDLSAFMHEAFPGEDLVVYCRETETGLLIGDSILEGFQNSDSTRKCASEATNDLIRSSTMLLDAAGSEDYMLALLDETHSVEAKPLQLFGSPAEGYDLNWQVVVVRTTQCGVGQELGLKDGAVACLPCTSNSVSALGLQCVPCAAGVVPNEERSSCVICGDSLHYDLGTSECRACDPPLQPNADRTACICPPNTYNSTRALECFEGDYSAPSEDAAVDGSYQCRSCEGLECVSHCSGDSLVLKPGWVRHIDASSVTPIFECRYANACPGGDAANNGSYCADNYGHPLCGLCDEGYVQNADGSCELCGDTTIFVGIAAVVASLAMLWILVLTARVLYNYVVVIQEFSQLTSTLSLSAISKVGLAFLQIVGSLSVALAIQLPDVFKNFFEGIQLMIRLDIGDMFKFGCVSDGAYVSSLIAMIVLLTTVGLLVAANYILRQYRAREETTQGDENTMREHVKELFERFDQDHAGISIDELSQIVREIDPDQTDNEIKAIFDATDSKHTGRIDFEEFFEAVEHPDIAAGSSLNFQTIVLKKQAMDITNAATSQLFVIVFLLCTYACIHHTCRAVILLQSSVAGVCRSKFHEQNIRGADLSSHW